MSLTFYLYPSNRTIHISPYIYIYIYYKWIWNVLPSHGKIVNGEKALPSSPLPIALEESSHFNDMAIVRSKSGNIEKTWGAFLLPHRRKYLASILPPPFPRIHEIFYMRISLPRINRHIYCLLLVNLLNLWSWRNAMLILNANNASSILFHPTKYGTVDTSENSFPSKKE